MKIEKFDEAQSHLESYYSIAKDLRILNRDLKNMIILDNSAYSFCFQI